MILEWLFRYGQPPSHPGTDHDRRSEEWREQTMTALRRTKLFRHTSRRLMIDFVDLHGIRSIGRGSSPSVVTNVQPAILVVLRGALHVKHGPQLHETVAELPHGVHFRHGPRVAAVDWAESRLEASPDGEESVPAFLVESHALLATSRILLRALDHEELGHLVRAIRPDAP